MGNNVDDFLENLGMGEHQGNKYVDQWDKIIQPASSYLIIGDVDTGKSGLAYWLLGRFSKKYNLTPATVGFPHQKADLLPENFLTPSSPSECVNLEDAIVFIDEADLQLPMEDPKARKYVVNFLSLPQHRNQIFLLAFHFPRLALGRYLPFFKGFLIKRPPYLLEFAGKRQGDELTSMMRRAEERFAEFPSDYEVVRHTYVVAPRIRWQGVVENPLPSFWSVELRKAWAGVNIDNLSHSPECKNCGKAVKELIGGLCPVCYRDSLDSKSLKALERKTYQKAVRRGEISLSQMKEGILDSDPPS